MKKSALLLTVLTALTLIGCNSTTSTTPSSTAKASTVAPTSSVAEVKESSASQEEIRIDIKRIIGSDKTRSKVEFGTYWQEDTNSDGKCDKKDEKQPILWQIIDVDEKGNALLFADKILDTQQFDNKVVPVSWETCTLRGWLNGNNEGDFLKEAFSPEQQTFIKDSSIVTKEVKDYSYDMEKSLPIPVFGESKSETVDKVFILSVDEMMNPKYKWTYDPNVLAGDDYYPLHSAKPSGFAANVDDKSYPKEYMLRNHGAYPEIVVISYGGYLLTRGWHGTIGLTFDEMKKYDNVTVKKGVRPALWVNLKEANLLDIIKYEQPVEVAEPLK